MIIMSRWNIQLVRTGQQYSVGSYWSTVFSWFVLVNNIQLVRIGQKYSAAFKPAS
jgi:hypothetical protein